MRTALITGATASFGKAIAESLAKAGCRLIIAGRRIDRLESLREELSSLTEVLNVPFDVRNKAEVNAAFTDLSDDWKNIDSLVNNTGLALARSNIEGGLVEDWDQMMDTNEKDYYMLQKLRLHY